MVFITGPLYAGKQTFAMAQWGLAAQDFSADPAAPCPSVRDVQELAACAPDLEALAAWPACWPPGPKPWCRSGAGCPLC